MLKADQAADVGVVLGVGIVAVLLAEKEVEPQLGISLMTREVGHWNACVADARGPDLEKQGLEGWWSRLVPGPATPDAQTLRRGDE